jgi:signal transduction histidine kinase
VRDNGIGVEAAVLNTGRIGHWGFPGMRERTETIGGQLSIQSELGSGTEVTLTVPVSLVDPPGRKGSFWRRIWIFAKRP